MDTRRLQTFVAVARERSFTRASLTLHLSQSAVSQQVLALERELGARLFERTRRRVDLTPAGAALFDRAERVLQEAETARRAVAAATGEVAGELDVTSSLTIAGYLLPGPLAALVADHPDVRVTMRVENSEQVARSLLAGEADLGFVEGEVAAEGLELETLLDDELVAIAPARHRLARRAELRLADLAAEPFVAREPGSGTRQVAEAALARAGFEPGRLRGVAERSGIDAIKAAVEAGLGLAIVSALTVRREVELGTLVARPVRGTPMRRRFAAAFAAGRPVLPTARELVRIVRLIRNPGGPDERGGQIATR
jgi:DNA-binding transcriptional LysR family regulator